MRQLLLLRHAKAAQDGLAGTPPGAGPPGAEPRGGDHSRALNPSGQAAAAAMGAAMRALGLSPDLVLVSTARRTQQTLEALEPWAEMPLIERLDALYLAGAPHILSILQGVSETVRSVLVIGHNPGLHDLALLLDDASGAAGARLPRGFPTCTLAEFTLGAHWVELGARGGRLERLLGPADFGERAH